MTQITISPTIHLSKPLMTDTKNMTLYLNDPVVYKNTLSIPYPYKIEDAEKWISNCIAFEEKHGWNAQWAIRQKNEEMIGAIGLLTDGSPSHKVEFGYWLAGPMRGKGIMTDVVKVFADYCINTLNYIRVVATVNPTNKASSKVLLKNGFIYEGTMRNFSMKDGKPQDVELYSKIKE